MAKAVQQQQQQQQQQELWAVRLVARRDRIVVSTLRCGRSNLGSNPSHGIVGTMARQGACFF